VFTTSASGALTERPLLAAALHAAGDKRMQQIADAVGVSRATLYRHMQAAGTGEA
jgi:AcrR family transcriptional regulator